MTDSDPSLGSCCICETHVGVTNIYMLDRKAPIAGHGWGCLVCGLPKDGAVVVLCEGCAELVGAGATPIYVCRGYPASDGRALYSELSDAPFGHDRAAHAAEENGP